MVKIGVLNVQRCKKLFSKTIRLKTDLKIIEYIII